MTHLFLDTNIVIDLLADRKPFSIDAAMLFDHAEKGSATLYLGAVSYTNLYYIMKKITNHHETIRILKGLEELTETIDTSATSIKHALYSEFKDFEDAVQYFTSRINDKIEGIVTRNATDFIGTEIAIWTPKQALGVLAGRI